MTEEKEHILDEEQLKEVVGGLDWDMKDPNSLSYVQKHIMYHYQRDIYISLFGTDEPPKP